MKINTKDTIAGFPILKIRDLLKFERASSEASIALFLKITKKQAGEVLKTLMELEYIEKEKVGREVIYHNTVKGNALGLSKAIPSITKEKAQLLFNGFMERVEEVNSNKYYLYKVTKVILFGSYITDAITVNDVDIAIETERKEKDSTRWRKKNEARYKEAIRKGVRFNNILDMMYYSEHEVRAFLKAKSRYLSLHSAADEILDEIPTQQVYSK